MNNYFEKIWHFYTDYLISVQLDRKMLETQRNQWQLVWRSIRINIGVQTQMQIRRNSQHQIGKITQNQKFI